MMERKEGILEGKEKKQQGRKEGREKGMNEGGKKLVKLHPSVWKEKYRVKKKEQRK